MTGKVRDDNDDGYGSSSRGRGPSNGRAPGPGNYHPINQNLLFGARNSDGDDSGGSGVNKPFVLPTGGGGDDKKQRNAAGAKYVCVSVWHSFFLVKVLHFADWMDYCSSKQPPSAEPDEDIDPRLKSCDPELIAKIEMEIVDNGDPITFDDIGKVHEAFCCWVVGERFILTSFFWPLVLAAGLRFAKKCVNELVIWPMARPDIFTGLRALPKGETPCTALHCSRWLRWLGSTCSTRTHTHTECLEQVCSCSDHRARGKR